MISAKGIRKFFRKQQIIVYLEHFTNNTLVILYSTPHVSSQWLQQLAVLRFYLVGKHLHLFYNFNDSVRLFFAAPPNIHIFAM